MRREASKSPWKNLGTCLKSPSPTRGNQAFADLLGESVTSVITWDTWELGYSVCVYTSKCKDPDEPEFKNSKRGPLSHLPFVGKAPASRHPPPTSTTGSKPRQDQVIRRCDFPLLEQYQRAIGSRAPSGLRQNLQQTP